MNLTSLLPNKTLLWKDLKNSSGFGLAFIGFVTLFSSIHLLNEIRKYYDYMEQGAEYVLISISWLLSFNRFEIELGSLLFVVALGAMLMGQERERNTFELLLAMPYSRREIIYNKFIAGLGYLAAAFILNAIIMSALMQAINIEFSSTIVDVWTWALRNVLVLAFIFAFTMMISTLSGTTVGNGLLSLIFLFFPMGFTMLIFINLKFWYDVPREIMGVLSIGELFTVPTYILHDSDIFYVYEPAFIYGLLILATMGLYKLTQYLFARNMMENNGEVLIFPQLEGLFKLGVTVCFALLGGPLLAHWLQLGSQLVLILGYLFTGGLFWVLINKIIDWRRTA